jgi:hypothetical protein
VRLHRQHAPWLESDSTSLKISAEGDPLAERLAMFTAAQYRAKAIEYSFLLRIAHSPNDMREYQRLERSFNELADNAQWLIVNRDKTLPLR